MTTLKEYKTMMEGATDAPWSYEPQEFRPDRVWKGAKQICHVIGDSGETQSNAQFIAASRNISPKLIRVIELAEEALCARVDPDYSFDEDMLLARKALSEIRKLKGER